jgi:hypothetical protein
LFIMAAVIHTEMITAEVHGSPDNIVSAVIHSSLSICAPPCCCRLAIVHRL